MSPIWRPADRIPPRLLPEPVRSWVFEPGSLTRKLKRVFTDGFEVRLEQHDRARPMVEEALAVGIRPGAIALIRQVFLISDGQARVYARTIIPLGTLSGPERRLGRLGTRPLGDVLFADPKASRQNMQIARIPSDHALFRLATRHTDPHVDAIWGRRALWLARNKPLLVAEIFLPALCEQPLGNGD